MNFISDQAAHDNRVTSATIDARLSKVVDVSLGAILCVAPLFMGGRHPLGRCVYVACVSVAALAWIARQALRENASYRRSGIEPLWLMACGLLVLQLTTLPTDVLRWLSPHLFEILPVWNGDRDAWTLGTWQQVTLLPGGTRSGLVMLWAHATLFTVVLQRIDSWGQIQHFLRWVAIAGILMALIGLAQYLAGNDRYLGVYRDPTRSAATVVRGTFFNENHFAHFLALSLAPLVVWFQASLEKVAGGRGPHSFRSSATQKSRLDVFVLGLGLALVVFAVLLTRSRGGIIILLISIGVILGQLASADRLRRRTVVALFVTVAALLLALAIHGHSEVRHEMASLTARSLEELDQHAVRRGLWQASFEIIRQFPLLGTGVGSFREVYPRYFPANRQLDYSYAESGFLQVLTETGMVGGLLMLWALAAVVAWVIKLQRARSKPETWPLYVVALTTIIASCTHSVFDFVWYLPACFATTLVIAACVCRGAQLIPRSSPTVNSLVIPPMGWALMFVLTVGLVVVASKQLQPAAMASRYWNAYLTDSNIARQSSQLAYEQRPAALPDWQDSYDTAMRTRQHLRRTVVFDPRNSRAHLRLASACVQLFELSQQKSENAMSLAQIRDAARASAFPSRAAQDQWLNVVLGPHRRLLDEALIHARLAIHLSPMEGDAYVHLAELWFLRSPDQTPSRGLINQAQLVRPHSAVVQFAAGREAVLEGRFAEALRLWRAAYQREVGIRHAIIQMLGPQLTADFFVSQFDPDLVGLNQLYQFYSRMRMDTHAAATADAYFARLTSDAQASATDWQTGFSMAAQLKQTDLAIRCAKQAVLLDPGNYVMRRRLAFELLAQSKSYDAVAHLEWCVSRRPADQSVREKLRWARRQIESSENSR